MNLQVIFYIVFIALTVLRFYMEYYLGWDLGLNSKVDDEMQVNNAYAILHGQWMGEYSNSTIPKHPMFPVFLAMMHSLHLSYPIGVATLICGSALLFVIAIKPICENVIIRGFFYVFLIYNPVGFADGFATRIYRNSLIPWAVLLVVASMVGLYLRKGYTLKKMFFWSVILGLSISFFWFLREDSIWMMPFIMASIGLIAIYLVKLFLKTYPKGQRGDAVKKNIRRIMKYIVLLCLPFLTLGLTHLGIAGLNKLNYGIFVTEDRVESSIGDVMSKLYRIDDGHNWKDERASEESDILVSSESIRLAQEASPTFARLDNMLACYYVFSGGQELWGDTPEWALRDAAAEKGYYRDAVDTEVFFAIVANELEKAFDEGILKKREGIYLSSQTGAFEQEDFAEAFSISLRTMNHILEFDFCEMQLPEIYYYDNGKIERWEWLLNISVPRMAIRLQDLSSEEIDEIINLKMSGDNDLWERYQNNNNIVSYSIKVYKLFVILYKALICVGVIIPTVWVLVKRSKTPRIVLNAWIMELGTLLTAFLNIFAVSLFSKSFTSDPNAAIFCFYSEGCYILFSVVCILGLCVIIYYVKDLLRKKDGRIKGF